jgi:aminopeptidase N
MFDAVSYQKGGRILNMLRNYTGDSAFYKSLNLFLITHRFKAAEAQELRLSFEEVTGQDLNWFWNQWYYGSGHPSLDISYDYDQSAHAARVFVKQTQPEKIFKLPVAIDVYQGGSKQRYKIWLEHKSDTFSFPAEREPDLVNVDGDKTLLCEKTDHKTLDNYIFQYKNAGSYVDRREAIDFAAMRQTNDPKAMTLLKNAINDRYEGLRTYAIQKLDINNDSVKMAVEPVIADLAKSTAPKIRAAAIQSLGRFKKNDYKELFIRSLNDSSYSVAGDALIALGAIDSVAALRTARGLSSSHVKGELSRAVNNILYMYAGEIEFDTLATKFDALPVGNNKFMLLQPFGSYLKRINNTDNFKKGIDMIVRFRDTIPEPYAQQVAAYFNGMVLNGIVAAKESTGLTEQADYVRSKMPARPKPKTDLVVPAEILQKYTGEYEFNAALIKVALKDNKTLTLTFPGQSEMELIPLSQTKFQVRFMEDYIIDFITDNNNEVTSLTFTSNGEEIKATRKK